MKEKSLFYKIKSFFYRIIHKNKKLLASENSTLIINASKSSEDEKIINDTTISTDTESEKDRIFNLYNDVKQGKVNLVDIAKSDLDKLVTISNEEIKILERTYAESMERLNKVS